MSDPRVCVVVSTYDRAELLPELVDALRAQTVTDFEAVLVDNGSTDGTLDTLRRLTADDPRFRIERIDDNRGPGRARNLGWRSASAEWVAFTDDDCAPTPTWLAELLAAGADADLVQGRTVPSEPPEARAWFDRSQRIEAWSGRYETCNLFVRRRLLEDHGGFGEQFHIAMGEDTDFGLRAVAGGARTAFASDAVVEHHVWRGGFAEYLRQRRRYAEFVQLMKVNPAGRGLLKFGFVLRGVHVLVWALIPMATVATVAGVPWLPLVAVAAWVGVNTWRTRRRPFGVPARIGYSTLQFVGFAYETFCYAAASVRYRTLVI